MLIERPAVEKAAEILKPDDFYRDAHRYIFEAMLALAERDEPIDLITLEDELRASDRLDIVGGRLYLINLMEAPATAANIEYYAHIVEEKAILRRLMDAGTQIQGLAHSEFDNVGELVDRAERIIFEIGQRRMGNFFTPLRPLLDEELDRIERRYENQGATSGRATPFSDLNYKMGGGLQPSDLIIVAARPGMGKCLRYDTLIDDPETGKRLSIAECVRRRQSTVMGIDHQGNIRRAAISDWIDSGVKPCFRVRTRLGRAVEVTGHHPFLTVDGWRPLHELRVGNGIAVPRRVPIFGSLQYERGLLRLMAYFIAEGGLTQASPRFTNTDPVLIEDFLATLDCCFPGMKVTRSGIDYAVTSGKHRGHNAVTTWLCDLNLMGKGSGEKRFPNLVWQLDRAGLAEFLRVLFSCDGTIYSMAGYPRIEFTVASSGLAEDIQHALTRFGIISKRWQKTTTSWRVEITDPVSVGIYQRDINWLGEKCSRFAVDELVTRRSIRGHVPQEAWNLVRAAAMHNGLSLCELARRSGEHVPKDGYNPHTNRALTQCRLRAYAETLDDDHLRWIANPDLYWDEIVEITPTGDHQVYDLTVADGSNFIAQDMCVHNTTLSVQLAQFIALNENIPVAIFSLEMSKEQLVTRMICSEAMVDAWRLRTGFLQNDDWQKVGNAISRLAEAPIYIDDTPDVSAMEMRAKCRRLQSEKGLGLVMIDYLQLMRSHKKTENRNQEISEIARSCKGLARELKVPVIALSQLSRAVESRPDKRPMLSDLRECVIGSTRLIDADTGRPVPISEVRPGDTVMGVGHDQKIEAHHVKDVWSTGIKPVYTLTTRTGKAITITANHPLLTAKGWKCLEQLTVGDVIGTALRFPDYGREIDGRDALCRLLGYLAGNGAYQKHRAIGFCGSDPAVVADAISIVSEHFPEVRWREKKACGDYREGDFSCTYENGYGRPYGNPLREWLRCIGVVGQKDEDKRVPDWVFEAGQAGTREYLAGYLSTDGGVKVSGKSGRWNVHFDAVSHQLAEDIQLLLMRLGIVAIINRGYLSAKATKPLFRVLVAAFEDNLRRFADLIKPVGKKGILLARMLNEPARKLTNGSLFSLPVEVSELMFECTKHLRPQGRKLEGGGLYWKHQGKRPHRQSCAAIAAKLDDAKLRQWAESDLLWEEVISIEPAGDQEVYDICIPGCGNFVANGIVAHNSGSIEAEADIVMFIYRDAYYKMKDAAEGGGEEGNMPAPSSTDADPPEETELILAKHRSGPTGKVKVLFFKQYTVFKDIDRTHGDDDG
jgi:replicative DNA helicase